VLAGAGAAAAWADANDGVRAAAAVARAIRADFIGVGSMRYEEEWRSV
jgi:hypothetical protein